MNIAGSIDWSDVTQFEQGDGSFSVSGGVATCTASTGATNRAMFQRDIYTQPGEIYEASVFARRLSGDDGASGGLFFDWPEGGSDVALVEINSSDWREYKVRYAIPLHATVGDYLRCGGGIYAAVAGSIEMTGLRISVANTPFGAPRSVGHALISWNGSSASLNANFSRFNIKGVSYNSGTMTFTIASERISNASQNMRPLMLAQMTYDGGANALKLIPKVGQYDSSSGEWFVRFVDMTTGSVTDVTSIGTFYFSVFFFI